MGDEPAGEQGPPEPWYRFIDLIDRLLSDDECFWAWDSLTGMRETVIATRRVTDGQLQSIQFIRASLDTGGE